LTDSAIKSHGQSQLFSGESVPAIRDSLFISSEPAMSVCAIVRPTRCVVTHAKVEQHHDRDVIYLRASRIEVLEVPPMAATVEHKVNLASSTTGVSRSGIVLARGPSARV
jgi:hypothetical protein